MEQTSKRPVEADLRTQPNDVFRSNDVKNIWKELKKAEKDNQWDKVQEAIHRFENIVINKYKISAKWLQERKKYWTAREQLLRASMSKTQGDITEHGNQRTGTSRGNIVREKLELLDNFLNKSAGPKRFSSDDENYEIYLLNSIIETSKTMKTREEGFIRGVNALSEVVIGEVSQDVDKCLVVLRDMETKIKTPLSQAEGKRLSNNTPIQQENRKQTNLQASQVVVVKGDQPEQARQEISRLQKEIKDLEAKLHFAENRNRKEKANAVAGSRLIESDSGLSDLSDVDRPQKLAERYEEICHQTCPETLRKLQTDEKEGIKRLHDILKISHEKCKEHSDVVVKHLMNELFHVIAGNSKTKLAPESLRKSLSKHFMMCINGVTKNVVINKAVEQLIIEKVLSDYSFEKDKVRVYVTACVSLCWKMIIKDPPMCFAWPDAGKVVDEDRFAFYSSSGKNIEFIAWPAMLHSEGGPLLCKGAVQQYPK